MCHVYIVFDNYEGAGPFVYANKAAAETKRDELAEDVHERVCVNKRAGEKSLHCRCTMSQGREMCASHHYLKTVEEHDVDECDIVRDIVVEEHEVL